MERLHRPVLLVVDVQQGFDEDGAQTRNNPGAEANIARLLAGWRAAGLPVIIVQHLSKDPRSPLHPDRPGVRLKPLAQPQDGELLLTKNVNSAFIGTDLEQILRRNGWDTLAVTGLTTMHCCSTTIRMAANLGFRVLAVDDAMAAFDVAGADGETIPAETVHRVELAVLAGEFATVVRTDELLAAVATMS